MSEKITLTAFNNFKIAADFYRVEQPRAWVILVHSMPATKEAWRDLADVLQGQGLECIAIDLRGHGESDEGPDGYKNFDDDEHQSGINDLKAAWEFLEKQGAQKQKTFLIGASIGANLCFQFISENQDFKKAVLLSPGVDYRGVKTLPMAKALVQGQSVFLASSKDDDGNVEDAEQIIKEIPEGISKNLIKYENAGHGIKMLQSGEKPDLTETIINFLKNE
ncbi:MAG: alpha/beta fold hydrolase [Candidatus Pacebacteria bacterium]|nr:alpha/beta fold hydrolase [Candidatus Paceibacterota bacterium]